MIIVKSSRSLKLSYLIIFPPFESFARMTEPTAPFFYFFTRPSRANTIAPINSLIVKATDFKGQRLRETCIEKHIELLIQILFQYLYKGQIQVQGNIIEYTYEVP